MVCKLVLLLFFLAFLVSCSRMPSRTEPFCYAKFKYSRDTKAVYGGVSCRY